MKKQDDLKLNAKRQSVDATIEVTEMLELLDLYFKAAMIKNASVSNYEHV